MRWTPTSLMSKGCIRSASPAVPIAPTAMVCVSSQANSRSAPDGHVACVWRPHAAFADADGLTHTAVVWAALDCPGFFAWVAKEGRHSAFTRDYMTGEVLRRPQAEEDHIVVAWPLIRQGRKETAGVALFSADGELMARGHQVWIMAAPPLVQATTALANLL